MYDDRQTVRSIQITLALSVVLVNATNMEPCGALLLATIFVDMVSSSLISSSSVVQNEVIRVQNEAIKVQNEALKVTSDIHDIQQNKKDYTSSSCSTQKSVRQWESVVRRCQCSNKKVQLGLSPTKLFDQQVDTHSVFVNF